MQYGQTNCACFKKALTTGNLKSDTVNCICFIFVSTIRTEF